MGNILFVLIALVVAATGLAGNVTITDLLFSLFNL